MSLPLLDSRFFEQHPPSLEFFQKWKKLAPWNASLLPLYEWQGILFIGTSSRQDEQKINISGRYVLLYAEAAPLESLWESWQVDFATQIISEERLTAVQEPIAVPEPIATPEPAAIVVPSPPAVSPLASVQVKLKIPPPPPNINVNPTPTSAISSPPTETVRAKESPKEKQATQEVIPSLIPPPPAAAPEPAPLTATLLRAQTVAPAPITTLDAPVTADEDSQAIDILDVKDGPQNAQGDLQALTTAQTEEQPQGLSLHVNAGQPDVEDVDPFAGLAQIKIKHSDDILVLDSEIAPSVEKEEELLQLDPEPNLEKEPAQVKITPVMPTPPPQASVAVVAATVAAPVADPVVIPGVERSETINAALPLFSSVFSKMNAHFQKSMILLVQGDSAKPWQWNEGFGAVFGSAANQDSPVDLKQPSPFFVAIRTENSFHGAVRPNAVTDDFAQKWFSGKFPSQLTIVPIFIEKNLLGLLLAQADSDTEDSLQLPLAEATAKEIEQLLIKNPHMVKAA